MTSLALDDEFSSRIPDDSGHDSKRDVSFGQNGPLLDMELEEESRQRAIAGNECAAPDASDFLPTKHHNRAGSDTLDGFDPRDNSQRTVETTPSRNAVEVRPDPAGVRHGV